MRKLLILLLTFFIIGCTAAPTANPTLAPVASTPQPQVTSTPADIYEISAWVDIPEPGPDDIVTVSGHLIRNEAYLGGVGMWMFWPDEEGGPVMHECVSYMMYQRGICQIIVKDYPPGKYVPVVVRVEFQDRIFTTETGFTPREK